MLSTECSNNVCEVLGSITNIIKIIIWKLKKNLVAVHLPSVKEALGLIPSAM